MKRLLLLMAIASITLVSCSKSDDNDDTSGNNGGGGGTTTLTVEKKNHAFLIDFSEDWCHYCGSNAGPTMDSLKYYEGDKINAIKVSTSSNNSSFNSTIGPGITAIYNNSTYGGSGVPKFIIANQYMGLSSNINSNVSQTLSKANIFNNDSVTAAVALSKSMVGDSMVVKTKVQFYKEQLIGTDIRLALYVVEDGIVSPQKYDQSLPANANFVHNDVVRTANSTNYAGVNINNNTAIVVDQVFEQTYTMYINPAWNKNNLKVVAAIWKMNSNPAKVINSNLLK